MELNKNSLCVCRWDWPVINFINGTTRTCCKTPEEIITDQDFIELKEDVFLNSKYQQERRLEMIKGIRHKSCRSCWDLEELNVESLRTELVDLTYPWIYKNGKLINTKTKEEIKYKDVTINSSITKSYYPFALNIIIDRICNNKCSYCGPSLSSSWDDDTDLFKPGLLKNKENKLPINFWKYFWKWFNGSPIRSLKKIELSGGEPLISKNFYIFIDKLIESYKINNIKHKPLLRIITNLNIPEKQFNKFLKYLPCIDKFFKIEINISNETLNSKSEYIRYGTNWKLVEKNLRLLCTIKYISIAFQIAINNLSITSTKPFLEFLVELSNTYNIIFTLKKNIVLSPSFHSPFILTEDFKSYITDSIEYLNKTNLSIEWKSYIDFLKTIENGINKNDDKNKIDDRIYFYHRFNEYDKIRKTSFLKTFPEYTEFYKYCKQLAKNTKSPWNK